MRFWIRELAGWALVALGLFLFLVCASLLLGQPPPLTQYLEAGPLMIIGIVVFRGGIHLLKVAMAARICLHAERKPSSGDAKKSLGDPMPTEKERTSW